MKNKLKCSNYFGLLFLLIHSIAFYSTYQSAIEEHAQYQLYWIPYTLMDFPTIIIFTSLQSMGMNTNTAALISFGFFGAIMWYMVLFYTSQKFCKKIGIM